jgi:SSS family solute:Na+ symporter
MPLRRKPFEPGEHLKYLKLSILGVGITIFILSILFHQTEKVFLFLNISGAIFVGGSGAVIIGGLYWKKGTTAAAWSAMIIGALTASLNILLNQLIPNFPINGQWGWFMAMILASVVYFLVSFVSARKSFELDKLLHRGIYSVKDDAISGSDEVVKGWKVLAPTREFTKGDRTIYWFTTGWTAIWVAVFILGTLFYFFVRPFTNDQWMSFWRIYTLIFLGASVVVTIWFTIGGFKNLREMIHALKHNIRDNKDDGFVDK